MTQQFTALAALPEGSGLVPNTRVSGLTTPVTLPPGGSEACLWPPRVPALECTYSHAHMSTHNLKLFLKER